MSKYLVLELRSLHCVSYLYGYLFNRFGLNVANLVKPIFEKDKESRRLIIKLVFEVPEIVTKVEIVSKCVKSFELTCVKPEVDDNHVVKVEDVDLLRKILETLIDVDKVIYT